MTYQSHNNYWKFNEPAGVKDNHKRRERLHVHRCGQQEKDGEQ